MPAFLRHEVAEPALVSAEFSPDAQSACTNGTHKKSWYGGRVMAREKAWAVAIARELSAEIPEAVRLVSDLRLTNAQIAALQRAFAARLVATMGEDSDETPRSAANRIGR